MVNNGLVQDWSQKSTDPECLHTYICMLVDNEIFISVTKVIGKKNLLHWMIFDSGQGGKMPLL
jgi:hypothetical protein